MMKKLLTLFTFATFVAAPAWAATKTVTLSVPGMTCAACPLTVKTALSKVEGVRKTDVTFDKREATVTFDEIGRASCRERVCQNVSISVVAVPLKTKHTINTRNYF